ncbi:hypothetical protein HanIR_Chr17g0871331 [Helianthus annuus]|nr:hypothetical protein HanIR_Chr17g0871331 [Helianthus annuus]
MNHGDNGDGVEAGSRNRDDRGITRMPAANRVAIRLLLLVIATGPETTAR